MMSWDKVDLGGDFLLSFGDDLSQDIDIPLQLKMSLSLNINLRMATSYLAADLGMSTSYFEDVVIS